MKKYIVAGNWKMNTSLQEGMQILENLIKIHQCKGFHPHTQIILFPPFTHLYPFSQLLDNTCIHLGAQNLSHHEKGAYTGEISAEMIRSTGATHVIVGHSERRIYHKENNQLLFEKVKTALNHNLTPIYCCGEKIQERKKNKHFDVVEIQITEGLFHLNEEEFRKVIIAYEPVWAIGTGETATPEQAQEMHRFIREIVEFRYGNDIASHLMILYGGSVKASNARGLFEQPDINGGLVGGASLRAEEFENIIKATY